jgi:hypothetical protein
LSLNPRVSWLSVNGKTDRARYANLGAATMQFSAGRASRQIDPLTSRRVCLTIVVDTSPILFLRGKTMTETTRSTRSLSGISALFQFRIWNLALMVVYVAIAIVDIQDQRRHEPLLIALAAAGFAAYGLIVWLGWHYIRRWQARLGSMFAVIVYAVAMGAIYLLAAILYLMAESAYLDGRFSRLFP